MLTIDTIPLRLFSILDFGLKAKDFPCPIANLKSKIKSLFVFSMQTMATATVTKFTKLKPSGRVLFIFRRYIIAFFALGALQDNIISRHNFNLLIFLYSTISETVPAPTVRPPSRIAKRKPFSMAIGAISSISICMLSPGITISTPAGRFATPVTSVVLK